MVKRMSLLIAGYWLKDRIQFMRNRDGGLFFFRWPEHDAANDSVLYAEKPPQNIQNTVDDSPSSDRPQDGKK